MLFPVRDVNRALTTPHVTRMLIMANVIVFLVMWLSDYGLIPNSFAYDLGDRFAMKPSEIINGDRVYTMLTSMFLHGGAFHLFGNMLYLYIFGDNVEDVYGHTGYLIFYLVCGLAASFAYIFSIVFGIVGPDLLDVRVIGASGAISGVLGSYVTLYPRAKILAVVFYGFPIVLPIPAVLFLGFWFLLQGVLGLLSGGSGGIAYWAHIGGFIAGLALTLVLGLRKKRARQERFRLSL